MGILFNLTPKQQNLSQSAKTLLNNLAFKKAFEEAEQHYQKLLKATTLSQVDEREQIYKLIMTLDRVKSDLVNRVNEGEAYFKSQNPKKALNKMKRGI